MSLRIRKQKKIKNKDNLLSFLKELFLSEEDIKTNNLSPKFKNCFEAIKWLKQKDNNFS